MSDPYERESMVLAADYESLRVICDELAAERDAAVAECDVWRAAYQRLAAAIERAA